MGFIDLPIDLPVTYWLAVGLLAAAATWFLPSCRESWAPGYYAVLATVFAWYVIEPFYFPEEFIGFTSATMERGYTSVAIFVVVFALATFPMVQMLRPRLRTAVPMGPGAEQVAILVVVVWLVLLGFGVWRADGDLFGALFPIAARSGVGVAMWGRAGASDAGPTGFLVSAGFYLYQLCLAAFGLLLPMVRAPSVRFILLAAMLAAWPYVFLQGARNVALAVVAPFFASYILYGRASPILKLLVLGGGFLLIDLAMLIVVNLRQDGFAQFDIAALDGAKHLGLNMASELMHITALVDDGRLQVSWGGNYVAHLLNLVPRALWPGKPLVGIEYGVARGFGGADNDLGVFATIAMGLIGQGVANFGSLLGPAVAAMLMAGWVAVLNRVRTSGSVPRTVLYLVGLGITFNLGRDITLLVLFPFVFGYCAVWLTERFAGRRSVPAGVLQAAAHR